MNIKNLQFNHLGLATIEQDGQKYVVDTLGNEYPLATRVEDLNPTKLAVELSDKELIPFSDKIWKNQQVDTKYGSLKQKSLVII